MPLHGRLSNREGELIAEGRCELEEDRAQVTMWPDREIRLLRLERGELLLELDNGRSLTVSGRPLSFRLNVTTAGGGNGNGNGKGRFVSMYRLPLAGLAEEEDAASLP